MSINLDLCQFVTPSETSYGFKMYDDDSATYSNYMSKEEYESLLKPSKKNAMLLVAIVREFGDDNAMDMLSLVKEFRSGMCINGEWYDWCPALRKALT